MLGVGKIVLKHDSLELQSPSDPKMPYILTSMSKTELIEHLKSKAKLFKILTGIFGVAGTVMCMRSIMAQTTASMILYLNY